MDDAPVDIVDRHRTTVFEIDRDGCDRCGPHVEAFVFVEMPDGKPLSYCHHCGTRFWVELNRQAAHVYDLRHMRTP
ncbi:hypothetical protein [Microbacterium sp. KR10-403]|uniref:DUF7455 domain-containing protein n=1 Tax=Microbacterium sp. KR10-403 TaxID=3158581 RepID=UPI0032E4CB7E